MKWDLEFILYAFCVLMAASVTIRMTLWCVAGILQDKETIRKLREDDALREQRQRERGEK